LLAGQVIEPHLSEVTDGGVAHVVERVERAPNPMSVGRSPA
jgi:hypothetical protein